MKTKEEKEFELQQKRKREFLERFESLPPILQFELIIRLYWMYLYQRIKMIPQNWIISQVKIDEEIRIHGMPYRIKRLLERWFNYPPREDAGYFLLGKKKVWYIIWNEVDNFELHLYYRDQFPGFIWLQPETNETATIIGIHIGEGFRNQGLGTMAFQESIRQLKGRIYCIKGVLEKEYYPNPEPSLRWLRRQGFTIKQNEIGDYGIVYWIK